MLESLARRQKQAEERRKQILAAAARVFSRKGYDRATTKEIAAEAQISEGTIYNYFASKHDLLMSIIKTVAPGLFETLDLDNAEQIKQRFVGGLEFLFSFVEENQEMLSVLASEAWRNEEILEEWIIVGGRELLKRAETRLRQLIDSGELRPVDPAIAARVIVATGVGLSLPVLLGTLEFSGPEERRKTAEQVTDLLLHGLLA
ncbi:MAG: TetR/AcrR family transcriptional regulator [Anaerolineae bacterium]|nr:TetR/AcrR family transcriptional regulator [Anaerolineae bacterium]